MMSTGLQIQWRRDENATCSGRADAAGKRNENASRYPIMIERLSRLSAFISCNSLSMHLEYKVIFICEMV